MIPLEPPRMQGGPPPPSPSGLGPIVFLLVLVGVGGVLAIGGAFYWLTTDAVARARAAPARTASGSARPHAELPPVTRRVPKHPLSLLDGCTENDRRAVVEGIEGAISVGAPLYNSGNFAGCFHLYEGTAADLQRRLPAACPGPVSALEAGRERAASFSDPSAQAWAMRDAFDGLLDVLTRSPE